MFVRKIEKIRFVAIYGTRRRKTKPSQRKNFVIFAVLNIRNKNSAHMRSFRFDLWDETIMGIYYYGISINLESNGCVQC